MRHSTTFGASHLNYCKYQWLILAEIFTRERRQTESGQIPSKTNSTSGQCQGRDVAFLLWCAAIWNCPLRLGGQTSKGNVIPHPIQPLRFSVLCRTLNLFLLKFNFSYLNIFSLLKFNYIWPSSNQVYSASSKEKGPTVLCKSVEQ